MKKTHICGHAHKHIQHKQRTQLSPAEIAERNSIKAYVTLGMAPNGIFYRLIWDCVLEVGIVLLVCYSQKYRNDVVVSIWKQDFKMPRWVARITPELVAQAKTKYIEKIQVARN